MEDDAVRMLRILREKRAEVAERIITGGVSAENVAEGYRTHTGIIVGLDMAIDAVKEVFGMWLPESEQPQSQKRRIITDY